MYVFRKYLPVLKGFPAKYIHAPWTAPENVQRAARCIIGKDYPRPIVDHHKVSTANLEKMRNVFKALLRYKESSKYIVPNNSVTQVSYDHRGYERNLRNCQDFNQMKGYLRRNRLLLAIKWKHLQS